MIEDGYADWKSCESGKKNGWRVRKEYGTAAELLDEIEREIRDHSLTFRALHSYDRVDGRKRPVAEPCDIAGFRVWRDHVALRERIYLHAVRAFGKFSHRPTERIARRACSLWGYLKHSDSRGTCKSRGIPQLLSQAKAYS